MTRKVPWSLLLSLLAIVLAFAVSIRSDLAFVREVSAFSMQGSPAPARDAHSPTGYVLGQRHFMGLHERGETYRWIAAAQEVISNGLFGDRAYEADTVPTGRPSLMPRLYAWWIAMVSWGLHVVSGESVALSVENAALWEPVIAQILAFAAAVVFMGRRYGAAGAAVAALCIAFLPPISEQFVPGVLTARTWALFFAAYAIAVGLPQPVPGRRSLAFSKRSALAASVALWLDPAFGFSAIVISAVVGAVTHWSDKTFLPTLKWSLIGCVLTLAAWLVDGGVWNPAVGELRYLHPFYALAWLGLGFALAGVHKFRSNGQKKRLAVMSLVSSAALIAPLLYLQFKHAYWGWLYSSVWMRRITSLDETVAYASLRDWIALAPAAEIVLVSAPLALTGSLLALAFWRTRNNSVPAFPSPIPTAVLVTVLVAFTFFRVRWGVLATLVAVPLVWNLSIQWKPLGRVVLSTVSIVLLLGLVAWKPSMPAAYRRPSPITEPTTTDLEALVHRHFSQWLASHTPGENVSALAPPELSDSLVFHGGCRVLMSTAWESYPGQIATNRILSALESTEAEAVILGHELTHVILPSWDKVLPVFVQKPALEGKDTLYDRLQRWVYPPFLRPVPYRLPPIPLFAPEKLAIFKITSPQDEALSLSRLAEYFAEMDRNDPAVFAAQVLAASHPNDPNAAIARATVYVQVKDQPAFQRELARLAADVGSNKSRLSWDRRVQRAIVLALGREHDLARKEVEACMLDASREDLFELTSLQAYRLQVLAQRFGFSFADAPLSDLLAALGAEYSASASQASDR